MTNTQRKELYAYWVSRMGRARVSGLLDSSRPGRSILDKAREIVDSADRATLYSLMLEAFDGLFHQTVYLRHVDERAAAQNVQTIQTIGRNVQDGTTLLVKIALSDGGDIRALLMIKQTMEFLTKGRGPTVSVVVPFPATVTQSGETLSVRVLTMQATIETWEEILGLGLRRMLTAVRADSQYDQALDFLRASGMDVGEYVDFSRAAIRLIKKPWVNTYSGTLEVKTVGSTRHSTLRGKGQAALRNSMPEQFEALVAADRIFNAEIEMTGDRFGLSGGSRIALYPATGKIAFRSRMEGGSPNAFLTAMA